MLVPYWTRGVHDQNGQRWQGNLLQKLTDSVNHRSLQWRKGQHSVVGFAHSIVNLTKVADEACSVLPFRLWIVHDYAKFAAFGQKTELRSTVRKDGASFLAKLH